MKGSAPGGTPRALGYRMPGEWDRHDATWLAWPHEASDWPGKFAAIPWAYAEIVRALAESETVELLVRDPTMARRARRTLGRSGVDLSRVRFRRCRTDRSWTRDSGPSFVRRDAPSAGEGSRVGLVQWKFNGWAQYGNWHADRNLPRAIARWLRVPHWRAELDQRWVVLEGGAIDVSGDGLLVATEECLLSDAPARNAGFPRASYEETFREYLGTDQVIWLRRGISGDDTHGHVDDVARFVAPRRVVVVSSEDPADPDFVALNENERSSKERDRGAGGASTWSPFRAPDRSSSPDSGFPRAMRTSTSRTARCSSRPSTTLTTRKRWT